MSICIASRISKTLGHEVAERQRSYLRDLFEAAHCGTHMHIHLSFSSGIQIKPILVFIDPSIIEAEFEFFTGPRRTKQIIKSLIVFAICGQSSSLALISAHGVAGVFGLEVALHVKALFSVVIVVRTLDLDAENIDSSDLEGFDQCIHMRFT